MKPISKSDQTRPLPRERGVALLVTLAILAMATVLLVAFVSNVRTERTSSKAFSDQLKARLAAQMAVEQAILDIRSMTQQSDYRTFVSNVVLTGNITNCITWFTNNTAGVLPGLVSGISYDYVNPSAIPDSVNLNAQGFIFPLTMVSSLSVPWVYYSNSFVSTSVEAMRGMTRYAYWIDDESSKINVNTAGYTTSRTNFDVSSIDLRGLPTIDATKASSIVSGHATFPYETVASLAQVGGGIDYTALFKTGIVVFATVNSADYERQTSGVSRLLINAYTNLPAGVAVTNLVRDIGANLQVFSNKFGATLFQLSANIHDQLTPGLIPTDSESNPWSLTGYLGIKNVPYLNEFAFDSYVYVSQPAGDSNFVIGVTNVVIWELFNLWKTSYYFSTNTLTCSMVPPVTLNWGAPPTNVAGGTVSTYVNGGSVGNYSYAVFTNTTANGTFSVPTNIAPATLTITFPSAAVTNLWGTTNGGNFYRLNIAAMPSRAAPATAPTIALAVGMVSAVASNMFHATVIAPGDPRVNKTPDRLDTATTRSFSSGENVDYYLPNSALGDNNNPTDVANDGGFPFVGRAFSVPGFLGNVSYPTNAWKTLKLYGNGYSDFNAGAIVPDWALLDVFTVNTHGARVPGKINVNTMRDLLANPGGQGALWGLLAGIQIYPAAGGTLATTYPPSDPVIYAAVTNIAGNIPYQHIGEIAVKAGVLTNLGSVGGPVQDTDERREAVVRALSGITTVRGNQFTIWGIGQSIQIVRGQTNVTGEAMIQAIVERTELFSPTNISSQSQLVLTGATYRIKYMRNVTE